MGQPLIGSVLDKYEVLQKLGEGATATVYRCRHLTIGKDVAIKVLHPHLSASSRYRERFNREARAVGRLSHQNIVSILDYSGQSTDECYIVTELVDGVTLLELLQERGRLPSEIAALVGADLAAALAFAHAEGIIHRDIKPENVMIRRDGRVKLMDFGVARMLDESSITLDGSLLGSPAYMSPQQALDEPVDGQSDIFSLGTVLFHAVTGHVPFSGTNASVILRNIIEANRPEVLELAPGTSPALAAVIDRLLQSLPEDRYANASEARAALLACLDEVGLSPDHPSINLRAYVVDPAACELALDAVVHPSLLARGKQRLADGDALGALQLFNRLLAIDEDNAEVITLIQSLHQAPMGPRRSRAAVLVLAAAIVLAGGSGAWWALRSPEPVDEPDFGTSYPSLPATDTLEADALPPEGPSAPVEPPTPEGSPAEGLTPVEGRPSPPPQVGRVPIVGMPRPSDRVVAPVPAEKAAPVKMAEVVIEISDPVADVLVSVDGEEVGKRTGGNPKSWVGTSNNPLRLAPGRHTIELTSPLAETWIAPIEVSEGERQPLNPTLLRKQVQFTVNPLIPDDCRMTVAGEPYEFPALRTFKLREPDPATELSFTCPAPLGKFQVALGLTEPGGSYILPTRMPEPEP